MVGKPVTSRPADGMCAECSRAIPADLWERHRRQFHKEQEASSVGATTASSTDESGGLVFGVGLVVLIGGLLLVGAAVFVSNAWTPKAETCRLAQAYGVRTPGSCVFYKFCDQMQPFVLVGGIGLALLGLLMTVTGVGKGIKSLSDPKR